MLLSESLVLSVGPAIAKAIIKRWLRSDIAVDSAGAIVDILKTKITDLRTRQEAGRQFEAIGEEVAANLEPLFEAEREILDEGDRASVILALANVFNAANLETRVIIDENLEPKQIANRLILQSSENIRLFSELQTSLFERIVTVCCYRIVDVASSLPEFNVNAVAELLERTHSIRAIALETLNTVRDIEELTLTASNDENVRRFEVDYRVAILRRLGTIELFGADLSNASRKQDISVAYVTLAVKEDQQVFTDSITSSFVNVDEAIAKTRCTLITGLAGSGKTTLLQWVAVHLKWSYLSRHFLGTI